MFVQARCLISIISCSTNCHTTWLNDETIESGIKKIYLKSAKYTSKAKIDKSLFSSKLSNCGLFDYFCQKVGPFWFVLFIFTHFSKQEQETYFQTAVESQINQRARWITSVQHETSAREMYLDWRAAKVLQAVTCETKGTNNKPNMCWALHPIWPGQRRAGVRPSCCHGEFQPVRLPRYTNTKPLCVSFGFCCALSQHHWSLKWEPQTCWNTAALCLEQTQ